MCWHSGWSRQTRHEKSSARSQIARQVSQVASSWETVWASSEAQTLPLVSEQTLAWAQGYSPSEKAQS